MDYTYGSYALVSIGSNMVIRRKDSDHSRTVAIIETTQQWQKFVAALKFGQNEIQAVHAIDL